ncbi:MAG: hypothetical protein H6751_08865 [Candidatus Omnitrophica bacterium]|nr:hypothetical protein [Candidatus Omnitrophota bacterium]
MAGMTPLIPILRYRGMQALGAFLLSIPFTLSWTSSCHAAESQPWKRHTIDQSSEGADGVRLMDVNGDGLMDIATGWEEGARSGLT